MASTTSHTAPEPNEQPTQIGGKDGAVYIGSNGHVAVVGEGTVIIGDVHGGLSMDFTTKKK